MTSPGDRRGVATAYVALAVLALFWGYSWVAVKVATEDGSPLVVAALRSALGALALLAFLAAKGRSLRPTPFLSTALYGLLQTAGFTLLQTAAVSLGGAGKVAILAYTMPFWLAILAWPLLGERIAGWRWVALGLAAAGLALVATPLRSRSGLASALAVSAGLVWAASAVFFLRLRARASHDVLSLTAWQMVWGALALVAVAAVVPGHVRLTASFAAAIAFLAIFATALGWALWLFVLSRLPATVAGVASLATPVVGVFFAAVQLHEIPSPRELGGIALILLALLVNWRSTARPARSG